MTPLGWVKTVRNPFVSTRLPKRMGLAERGLVMWRLENQERGDIKKARSYMFTKSPPIKLPDSSLGRVDVT
jgi:hypothetical protein